MSALRFYVGSNNSWWGEPHTTLAEAAEAVRTEQGWTEIHLSNMFPSTIACLSTWSAYPTKEQRDVETGWETAPCIYEL